MLIDVNRAYLAALIFSSILAWASFFSVIFFTNPQSAGLFGVIVLYISFAVGIAGLFIFFWQTVKLKKWK